MGGLVARYYVQCLGGDERVHTLVTLGTPHDGTRPCPPGPAPAGASAAPGQPAADRAGRARRLPDPLRRGLERRRPDGGARPQRAALEHPDLAARNVLVPGAGHMSLPIDRRVVHEVSTSAGPPRPRRLDGHRRGQPDRRGTAVEPGDPALNVIDLVALRGDTPGVVTVTSKTRPPKLAASVTSSLWSRSPRPLHPGIRRVRTCCPTSCPRPRPVVPDAAMEPVRDPAAPGSRPGRHRRSSLARDCVRRDRVTATPQVGPSPSATPAPARPSGRRRRKSRRPDRKLTKVTAVLGVLAVASGVVGFASAPESAQSSDTSRTSVAASRQLRAVVMAGHADVVAEAVAESVAESRGLRMSRSLARFRAADRGVRGRGSDRPADRRTGRGGRRPRGARCGGAGRQGQGSRRHARQSSQAQGRRRGRGQGRGQEEAAKPRWVLPVSGARLSASFGEGGGLWENRHTGQDFAAPTGTPVRAAAAGVDRLGRLRRRLRPQDRDPSQ